MTRSEIEARIEEAYREEQRMAQNRRNQEAYYNSECEKELERNRELAENISKLIVMSIILFFKLTLFIVTKLVALLIFLLKTNTAQAVLEFLKNYLIIVLLGLRVLPLFPFLFLQSIYLEIFKKTGKTNE